MSEQLRKQPVQWITTAAELKACCDKWITQRMLAVDTEFMRSQTYYPITGLIQVNDGNTSYLIDPLAFDDFTPLAELMENPGVLKVLHSCSEDLEVFHRFLGIVPKHMLDTQIASALCGYGFSVGFGKLVHAVLGEELPKEETRSDWLHRPLSSAQIDYAAIDVEYLYKLASILVLKLKNLGRLTWVAEDCEAMLRQFADNQVVDNSDARIKQAWRLSPRQLAILKNLAQWREEVAQRRDVPRNRVIKEHSLLDLAQRTPDHVAQLRKLEGINERMIRTDGADLIACIQAGLAVPEHELPAPLPRPLSGSENKWAKTVREKVSSEAERLQLAPEILLKKRDYEALTRAFMTPEDVNQQIVEARLAEHLTGWRYNLLAAPLANVILHSYGMAESC
ncbi:ribonuclease D [Teredinibacter turnerae]|uniref:ribonuclease D n=1 Tax=Teredinibacter turnerae TaxID=2426 RepID=UPI0004067892|nr:ribonuclease D [Teredinibacter turnerae]